jgi:hypothetical protein
MSHTSPFTLLFAGIVAMLAYGTVASADELASRKALGIEPIFLSVPLPSGSLSLDLSDTAVIEVMGLTRTEAEQVVAARSMAGLSAAVLPTVVGDLFGVPPMTSSWDSVRDAVAANTYAKRPTVGIDD